MKLQEIPGIYSVLRFDSKSSVPGWVQQSRFYSVGKTDDELSITCDSSVVPAGEFNREDGWKCLKVMGPLDFSLTGVLSSIAKPLADAKISIFAISTFDTDYVLVKQENISKAKDALREAGFDVRVVSTGT